MPTMSESRINLDPGGATPDPETRAGGAKTPDDNATQSAAAGAATEATESSAPAVADDPSAPIAPTVPPVEAKEPDPVPAIAASVLIGSSLLDSEEVATVLYYGDPGTTKTTSVLSMANLGPMVFINAEAGAKRTPLLQRGINLANVRMWPPADRGPDYITYQRLVDEVFEPMRHVLEQDPTAHVGIGVDSFSELSRRLLDKNTAAAAVKAASQGKSRDAFQVDLADHGVTSQMMRTLLRQFRDLNIHMAVTALERRDQDQNTGEVSYGPAVGPAIANDTMGLVDIVMYCTVEQIGSETFAIGTSAPVARRKAKDRFGVLPTRMVDPTMERIIGYLNGSLARLTDPRQIAAREAMQAAANPTAAATG